MADYAVEMIDINMIFNGTIYANKNVNLKVKKGEIHALVGENGAGKSTLMSILFGLYEPSSGEIKVNGKTTVISNPIKANHLGIGMVHQHFKMVDIFPFWLNIALGEEKTVANLFLNKKAIIKKITAVMKKYNLEIDLNKVVSKSTVGEQQRAEILKILYRDAEILVFDEPTAVLTPIEIDGLLQVMKELQKAGKTIIFISHKMAEIEEIANSATVLRLGEVVGEFDMRQTTIRQLAEAMVGRKLVEVKNDYQPPQDEVVLKLDKISVAKTRDTKGLEPFDLEIHAGEIVAIAGVEGNGQQEIAEVIAGMKSPSHGHLIYKGEDIIHTSIAKRYMKYNISHIPEDRHKHGLVLDLPITENMALQDISTTKFSKFGFINKPKLQAYAQEQIKNYDVRGARSGYAISRELSGGNQQKAIVARELSREHEFIIIFQPTRGLDVGSIEYIHEQILEDKKRGRAVLLISYELSEVMALADRIVVVNSGRKVGELPGKGAVREKIGAMMLGQGGE